VLHGEADGRDHVITRPRQVTDTRCDSRLVIAVWLVVWLSAWLAGSGLLSGCLLGWLSACPPMCVCVCVCDCPRVLLFDCSSSGLYGLVLCCWAVWTRASERWVESTMGAESLQLCSSVLDIFVTFLDGNHPTPILVSLAPLVRFFIKVR